MSINKPTITTSSNDTDQTGSREETLINEADDRIHIVCRNSSDELPTDPNVTIEYDNNQYMIDCLIDEKHSQFGPNKQYEDLLKIVLDFRGKVLTMSQRTQATHALFGRRAVYQELAHAFAIARTLLMRSNRHHVKALLEECQMTTQAERFIKKKGTNNWAYICGLLYGSWEEQSAGDSTFLVFKRDRSAEKYGNVMRYLYEHNVSAQAAAMFIETFSDPVFGKALLGIEKADRAAHPAKSKGKGIKQVLKHRELFIKLGESRNNDDVFYMTKPEELPDSVEYGTATFKVVGSKLMIVGFDAWEEADYEKFIITKGRAIKKEEDRIRAAATANKNTVAAGAGAAKAAEEESADT
ncbi:hypothetical protein [Novosphingobium sp.]|uniref:hypothetical protein n=1 Tax=Novosphingobium sp. TaxID=1874826 RepID=UPI002FDB6570